ncbi:MAG: methylmalonyl-CoA carboxyltransferase, partial [Anaerolineales bacterium]|nr:methylmalonyl-CoA carboxyltransferase [Anaerolineales bacterium]
MPESETSKPVDVNGEDPRIVALRALRQRAQAGGGAERTARQHAKGKLTARERLNLLLDPETFNELEPFITHQGDELGLGLDKYLSDGVITGYGQVEGRTVYVYAQDFTIYGGTLSVMQSHKICRVMDLALRNGVPIVGLIDSGGARIQEGVKSLGGYAE